MTYICYCTDHPESAKLREAQTPAHLQYIESILDRILVAGPLIDSGTGMYNASCFIYRAETEEEALELLHNDPYFIAGVYAKVSCRPFVLAAGTWIGGKTW